VAKKEQVFPRTGRIRCAIYTRKSSEEGLEQEFNSLHAQHEACLAFIASQRHEGWTALPDRYDDGGISGGTMDRPALQRLLADVAAGRVDAIVVYKVDRLTRSLADFAKIVEILDARTVSFVSVTQAFNTTTSMGRLTLNVLLSFAQFEREVTGERIRDKIAASKRKGLWMGGYPALGYDVQDRKLVVNEGEAETVRRIFRRYRDLRSVRELKDELDAEGIRSKLRVGRAGRSYGGQPLGRGALYAMLANRMYRGGITHKGQTYPGEHHAIVDEALWTEVQALLAGNAAGGNDDGSRTRTGHEISLLTGILYDAAGQRLTPTHALKNGTRYRYYVSQGIQTGASARGSGQRIPAAMLEALVRSQMRQLLLDPMPLLQPLALDAARQHAILAEARLRAERLQDGSGIDLRQLLLAAVPRLQVHLDRVELALSPDGLLAWLDGQADGSASTELVDPILITIPAQLKRVGIEMRFITGREEQWEPDATLVKLLTQANGLRHRMMANTSLTVEEAARDAGVGSSYASRLLRLAFIAPDIVVSILSGRQPVELTPHALMSDTRLPLDWTEQRRSLGFASA
jgi:site-specific DNA recombinase